MSLVSGRSIATATAFLLFSASGAESDAARLAGRATGDTPLAHDLSELCDGIGGRPTGSEACKRAEQWAARKFTSAGLEHVRLEPFHVPNLWLPGTSEAAVLSPVPFVVRVAAAPFTASTKGSIERPVLDVGEGTPAEFAKLGAQARGAILLVRSKEMKTFDDLFAEYMRNSGLIEGASKAGAAALLLESTRPRGLLYRHPLNGDSSLAPIPAAIVSREHASRIARLAQSGPVRMRLNLANQTGGAFQAHNVVAEIKGRTQPDQVVLIGAHLDSWDLGTGAEDNGVNAAMVIDIARGFRALGITPERTIRFVLFTGEEQGMWGSAGYVRRHRKELDKHVAVVIFDTGSGHNSGFYLNGREELREAVNSALSPVPGLNATAHLTEALDGTDNFDFLLSGVPNLVAIQDPATYLPDYHAESDTYERSNIEEQKATAAVASVLLYGLAATASPLPCRQTRAQVEKLIIDTKLDQQMRLLGQWDDWKAGRRGLF